MSVFSEIKERIASKALKLEISVLYHQHRSSISDALRNRMYHAVYGYSSQTVAEMQAIVAEVTVALKPQEEKMVQKPITETGPRKIDLSRLFGGNATVR